MIYEIQREVATALAAQGCPLDVVYGPERPGAGMALASPRIVFERDRARGDEPKPGRARKLNPRMVAARGIGAVCRIFAQNTNVGARVHEHERMADLAVDKVIVALYKVCGARMTEWRITSAKLLSRDELSLRGLETWPGAVYELHFTVDRAVNDTTWAEAAREEVTVTDGMIETTTKIGPWPAGTPLETV